MAIVIVGGTKFDGVVSGEIAFPVSPETFAEGIRNPLVSCGS